MRRHWVLFFFVLFLPLLVALSCNEVEEIPGQRVPLGDVSMDYWESVPLPFEAPVFFDAGRAGHIAVATRDSLAIFTSSGSWECKAIGDITALEVYEQDGSKMWLVSGQKILISTDGGSTFTEHAIPESFTMVVPHPRLEMSILAISDTALWRSDDNGVSWQKIYVPPENPSLSLLAVDLSDTSYMYLIDAGGLRISSDGGIKWDSRTYFEQDSVTHLKTTSNGVFVGAGGFIRFSASHGDANSWLTYAPYFSSAPELADFLVIDDQTILYACFNEAPGEYQAYLTRDLNAHWANASPGLIGYRGKLTLAISRMDWFSISGDTYFALLTSEKKSFLYQFSD